MRNTLLVRNKSLFDEIFADFDRGFNLPVSDEWPQYNKSFSPRVDVDENKDYFLISVDLPGLDENNVSINVENSLLTIKGQRSLKRSNQSRSERFHGEFQRSFQLPQSVNQEEIEARFDKGVLDILVPKIEKAKPKLIEIKTKDGGNLFKKLLGKESASEPS